LKLAKTALWSENLTWKKLTDASSFTLISELYRFLLCIGRIEIESEIVKNLITAQRATIPCNPGYFIIYYLKELK
jgi:hypothetical protein